MFTLIHFLDTQFNVNRFELRLTEDGETRTVVITADDRQLSSIRSWLKDRSNYMIQQAIQNGQAEW